MKSTDVIELDRLLARGSLSGSEYDQIEARILDRVQPRSANRVLRPLVPAVAGLAMAAAVALLVVRPSDTESFRAKGGGTPGLGVIEMACAGTTPSSCPRGSTVMFSVNAAVASGYLGAYAESLDDPARPRIWYFPTRAGVSPHVATASGTVVVPQGVRLGHEHAPGRYRIHAWLSREPLTRSELEPRGVGATEEHDTFDLSVE